MARLGIKPTKGVLVVAAMCVAFFVASRTTGAGWLIVMIAVGLGLLGASFIAPRLALRGIHVELDAPDDALVGRPMDVAVTVTGASQFGKLRLITPDSDWVGTSIPGHGSIRAVANKRGVVRKVMVEVSTATPTGLVWATRRLSVPLAQPIAVAPRVTPTGGLTAATKRTPGTTTVGSRSGQGETVRSIRDYRSGDSMRMIHWPATARFNDPVVKEMESPDTPHLVIRLDLSCNADEAERRASLAYGYVQQGLSAGLPVQLLTCEVSGPHAGYVGSMLEAGRRLAHATDGQPASRDPEAPHATIVDVT